MTLIEAFSPAAFRKDAHRIVDQLADYLGAALDHRLPNVLPPSDPATMAARWATEFSSEPSADIAASLDALIGGALADSNHLHHPRYVGHQVTSPLPVAALCEMVAALLNNGMAVFEMGPAATAMERSVIRWMTTQLGFTVGADGFLTSGGSLGNLTALLAARQAKAGFDAWTSGNHGGPPLAVLVSEQAHYCVQRSVQIMGWGQGGAVKVAVDEAFRLRTADLPHALQRAQADGRRVIAVAASACSTATGSFDDLDDIADFCAAHDLWMHVDAAHGGSAALSPRHRHLVKGIERADSVVWDAHKMLLMPALVTAVLFRDGTRSYQAFAQEASYLLPDPNREEQWYNGAIRTLECTKRMMSLKLYVTLRLYGTRLFADYVAATFDLAQELAQHLRASADFELAVEPQSNIVCFRYSGTGGDLDGLQAAIRARVLAEGSFYLVQTQLPAGMYLRVTLINPFTTIADLTTLLDSIRTHAAQIAARAHDDDA